MIRFGGKTLRDFTMKLLHGFLVHKRRTLDTGGFAWTTFDPSEARLSWPPSTLNSPMPSPFVVFKALLATHALFSEEHHPYHGKHIGLTFFDFLSWARHSFVFYVIILQYFWLTEHWEFQARSILNLCCSMIGKIVMLTYFVVKD